VTAEGTQQDAQIAMDNLCKKPRETKASKYELKERVEKLTYVLLKLSKPKQVQITSPTPTPIRFDFSFVPKMEKLNQK
ncbi:hypothetical protein KI387_007911, partial [Taxus chinensis]